MTGAVCARCGTALAPGARFCLQCGHDVSGQQTSVATVGMTAAPPPPPPTPPPEPPPSDLLQQLRQATLGDYEILGELGRGGMATVFLAHDISLGRKVAIKVMAPALVTGPGMIERFKREARTAASLSHPNIIPIHSVREIGNLLFFVMKCVEGRPLDSIIREHGQLPIPMIRAILAQVAGALGYAHRRGIVHRDIKPANIMLDDEGWAVVTDFGIAKVTDAQGLTMTGVTIGTPAYMSPEQCAAKEVTGQSDQYSLGIVAYEMLAGKVPFEADTVMGLMWQHFHDPPRPITELRPDCPPELADVIMRMLAKPPADRWPSLEDVVGVTGSTSLAHDDPIRQQMRVLAQSGQAALMLGQVRTPQSPIPAGRPSRPQPPVSTEAPTVASGPTQAASTPTPASPRESPRSAAPTPPRATVDTRSRLLIAAAAVAVVAAVTVGGWLLFSGSEVDADHTTVAQGEGVAEPGSPIIPPAPVSRVIVGPSPTLLTVGESGQLSAIPMDEDGNPLAGREVSWRSSTPSVATVSSRGLVQAVAAGAATITAAVEGREGTATLNVGVTRASVSRVEIVQGPLTLAPGDSVRLTATARDDAGNALGDRQVSWASSDAGVLEVTAAGLVVARRVGTATVTATTEGVRTTARMTVEIPAVATIALSNLPAAVVTGDTFTLRATLRDAGNRILTGRALTWRSSDPAVATVSSQGSVRAAGTGTTTITVATEGRTAESRITVRPPPPVPVAAIRLRPGSAQLEVGRTVTVAADLVDQRGNALADRPVTWRSSDDNVATVSGGVVTARRAGSVVIAASAEGRAATISVTVTAPAAPAAPDAPTPAPAAAAPPEPETGTAATAAALREGGLATGASHTCGVLNDGRTVCWGEDAAAHSRLASAVSGLNSVVAGEVHTCGLTGDGTAVCWGTNRRGQLGADPRSDRPVTAPVRVAGGRAYRMLAAGSQHTCGIATDGTGWCWGENDAGQLGNGSRSGSTTPVGVRGDLQFRALAAGEKHTCGIAADGRVHCWGDGFSGQLGIRIRESANQPRPVDLPAQALALAAGRRHSCAVLQNGETHCWGENAAGELGDGSRSERLAPVQVSTRERFVSITAGREFTCAATQAGAAYCWGRNRDGQLGDGTRNDRNTPVRVRSEEALAAPAAGQQHACALTRARQPVCWGANRSGQLGTGSTDGNLVPAPVQSERLGRP